MIPFDFQPAKPSFHTDSTALSRVDPDAKGTGRSGERDRASAGFQDGERHRGHADDRQSPRSVRLADEAERRFRLLVPEPADGVQQAAHHDGAQAAEPDAQVGRAASFLTIRAAPHVCDPAQRRGRGGSFRDADAATRRRLGVQALQPGEAEYDAGSAVEAGSAGERARRDFLYG